MLGRRPDQFLQREWMASECPDVIVQHLCLDSRDVTGGDAFIALRGQHQDGSAFIADAVRRGAVLVLVDAAITDLGAMPVPCVRIHSLASHVAAIADRFYQSPSHELALVGITGTNGKTSLSWAMAALTEAANIPSRFIGTLGAGSADAFWPLRNTTPDIITVQRWLRRFADEGVQRVFMEVSSIGIAQGRIDGLRFTGAVFTNLSRDHLDYHGDMQRYEAEKTRLFTDYQPQWKVINLDDIAGQRIYAATSPVGRWGFSLHDMTAALCLKPLVTKVDGASAEVIFRQRSYGEFHFSAVTHYELENAAAAILVAVAFGFDISNAIRMAQALTKPPGRLQAVSISGARDAPLIFVDYAHTPDALQKVLEGLRIQCDGRLICVVGCGGDRDAGKRPQMGELAASLADFVIFTADNPRSEDPEKIITDMTSALSQCNFMVCIDRAEAIHKAVDMGTSTDIVLIAGKGHEGYQEVQGQRLPFSDAAIASAALQERVQ